MYLYFCKELPESSTRMVAQASKLLGSPFYCYFEILKNMVELNDVAWCSCFFIYSENFLYWLPLLPPPSIWMVLSLSFSFFPLFINPRVPTLGYVLSAESLLSQRASGTRLSSNGNLPAALLHSSQVGGWEVTSCFNCFSRIGSVSFPFPSRTPPLHGDDLLVISEFLSSYDHQKSLSSLLFPRAPTFSLHPSCILDSWGIRLSLCLSMMLSLN